MCRVWAWSLLLLLIDHPSTVHLTSRVVVMTSVAGLGLDLCPHMIDPLLPFTRYIYCSTVGIACVGAASGPTVEINFLPTCARGRKKKKNAIFIKWNGTEAPPVRGDERSVGSALRALRVVCSILTMKKKYSSTTYDFGSHARARNAAVGTLRGVECALRAPPLRQ